MSELMSSVKVRKSTVHCPRSTAFFASKSSCITVDCRPWTVDIFPWTVVRRLWTGPLPIGLSPVLWFCGFALVFLEVLNLLVFHGLQQGIGFFLADFHLLQLFRNLLLLLFFIGILLVVVVLL